MKTFTGSLYKPCCIIKTMSMSPPVCSEISTQKPAHSAQHGKGQPGNFLDLVQVGQLEEARGRVVCHRDATEPVTQGFRPRQRPCHRQGQRGEPECMDRVCNIACLNTSALVYLYVHYTDRVLYYHSCVLPLSMDKQVSLAVTPQAAPDRGSLSWGPGTSPATELKASIG